MNRLQKKCFIAATGFHLLLLVILFVGPAFLSSRDKSDNPPILEVVPDVLTDAKGASGGNPTAKPPLPTPPEPQPPVVQPQVTPPPQPRHVEKQEPPKPLVRPIKPDPDVVDKTSDKPHKPQISTNIVVRRPDKPATAKPQPDTRAQELADARRRAEPFRRAAESLRGGLSGSTKIDAGPGGGGPVFANYSMEVQRVYKQRYDQALLVAGDIADGQAAVEVTVTILRDGTVLSGKITNPSGNAALDKLVRRVLDAVNVIRPFPEGAERFATDIQHYFRPQTQEGHRMKFKTPFNFAAALLLLILNDGARAGEKIFVPGEAGDNKAIPVSISGFTGEAAEVIQFDLYVQGFSFTTPDAAQFLISGSNNGNLTGRVTDRFNKSSLVSKSYTGAALRRQAHAFVDDFVHALGRKGIAQTKIAFKVDTGANSEIYIADFDGHSAQVITHDNTIVAAPAWVPRKLALYYTSYKLGNPDIFLHDLGTGQRNAVAHYSGLNTSAAPSPDGSKVAMILSKSGSPDVYVCNADGSGLKQLTHTREDESSPCWSADGQWICFAAKINERRSLGKVPASGGAVQRISTSGVSNPTEPDWSPDGKWIVFTAMMGGFEICVVPAQGGTATVLVSGEDPSWAPNSRTVVFARRSGGSRRLSLLDVPTKQTKDVSRISGSNSQPSWAK